MHRLEALAGPHQRLAALALPAETPLTEVLLNERREPELRARRLRATLRQSEERTGRAAALAAARGRELERAAPHARALEWRIAEQESEVAELRALAESQAEALGLRIAEVEALAGAFAERSALAARQLLENRALQSDRDRVYRQVEDLDRRARQSEREAEAAERRAADAERRAAEAERRAAEGEQRAAEAERIAAELERSSTTAPAAAPRSEPHGRPAAARGRGIYAALLGTLTLRRRTR
jgi:hypothetical protein